MPYGKALDHPAVSHQDRRRAARGQRHCRCDAECMTAADDGGKEQNAHRGRRSQPFVNYASWVLISAARCARSLQEKEGDRGHRPRPRATLLATVGIELARPLPAFIPTAPRWRSLP